MQQRQYTARGMAVGELPVRVTEEEARTYRHSGESHEVVLYDSFSLRVLSTVRAVLFFDRTSRSTYDVGVVAGSVDGRLPWPGLGADRALLGTVDTALDRHCEFLDLDLVRHWE
jgi:hypothetical protein